MKKKNFIAAIFSLVGLSLAADIQVLPPSGADFATEGPNMVQSIVRAAVGQTGNTPVESSAEIQLRTTLMTMGSSIVVVSEQVKNGTVVGTGKEKAPSVDDLDVAIENATKQALANVEDESASSQAYAPEPSSTSEPQVVYVVPVESSRGSGEDPNENFARKRPTRNYVSYGLGMAMWHNYDYVEKKCVSEDCHRLRDTDRSWEQAFVFHYARIFEVIPQAAITIVNNMNISFGDEWQWHEAFLLGGRFFPSTGVLTPFIGAGIGLGIQSDDHYYNANEGFAIGLAGGAELGIIFFRNSSVQLEIGFAWDALWDGFESFDRRFGAGSGYIAINY